MQISLMELTIWMGNTKVLNMNTIVHPVGGELFCPQRVNM
jgi:hypothetical protein